jgi:hypothetical protein
MKGTTMKKTPEQPRSQKLAVRLRELTYTGKMFREFKEQAPGAATRLRIDVDEALQHDVDGLLVQMTTSVLANAQRRQVTTHKQVPATWWDHLKLTIRPHLPLWLFRRVHINYTEIERSVTITETRTCAHMPYANRQDHDSFIAFVDPPASPAADGVHLRESSFPPVICLVCPIGRQRYIAADQITADGAIVVVAGGDSPLDRAKVDIATAVQVVDSDDCDYYLRELLHYAEGMGKTITTFVWED